jgi:hypothetical protein
MWHEPAAAAFLDWLTARGLTLATCTQAELDQWLAGTSGHLIRSANFVRWAVTRRHASRLTAPASRWTGPSGPLDQDRRWADARRLLHEEAYPAADRVAGLLILLYAQKLNVIALARRLHALGISPRQGRSTALFTLAADVPAAILAKTLGIHVQAAIQWQKISAGDWAAYAADVSRRSGPRPLRSSVPLVTMSTAPASRTPGNDISFGTVMTLASRPKCPPGRSAADPPP